MILFIILDLILHSGIEVHQLWNWSHLIFILMLIFLA